MQLSCWYTIYIAYIWWCCSCCCCFVSLQYDESHSVVLPAFIDSAQRHEARLYGTAGRGSGNSWNRSRRGSGSGRSCQRISSGLPRCTGHAGAYFIHSTLYTLCHLIPGIPYHSHLLISSHFAVWPQMSHIFLTVFHARIFIGHFRFL